MVASYSKQKAKYTYAERIVGALSQIQREHKKHAVHLATLRSQIRKNAADNKDKLGPQWSNWVSRAVTKLEDQGVLEASGAGNVTFTADAKKALTTARRESIHLPTLSQAGVNNFEDLMYKQVAGTDFVRGTKRPRRRASAVQPRYVSDDDDDEELPSASVARRRSTGVQKRARRSSGKAIMAKTKRAEVQEAARLQEELEDTRRQLAEAQELLASSPVRGSRNENRPQTPEPFSDGDRTPPTTILATAKTASRRGLLFGVIRTESGSLINNYSKQPTPAPSSPGGRDYDMNDELPPCSPVRGNDEDVFTARHGLATPSSSVPYNGHVRSGRAQESDEMNDFAPHGSPLTPLQSFRELELETEVSDQVGRTAKLQDELQQKSEQLIAQDASLVAEQNRVQNLQKTNAELEASCVEKDTTIVGVQGLLRDAEALASTLRSSIAARQELHDVELDELRNSLASYRDQLEVEKGHVSAVDEELQREKSSTAMASEQLAALRIQYDTLQEVVTTLRMDLENVQSSLTDAEDQRTQAELRSAELAERIKSLQERLLVVTTARNQATADQEVAERALSESSVAVDSLRESLSTTSQELELHRASEIALEAQLTSLQEVRTNDAASIEALRNQSVEFETTIDRLEEELRAAAHCGKDLAAQIQGYQAREAELVDSRDQVLQQLGTLKAEVAATKTALELTVDELTHRLQTKDDEVVFMRADIDERDALTVSLQAQLTSLQASLTASERALAETTEHAEALQVDVASLRVTEAILREALDSELAQRASERAEHEGEVSRLQVSTQQWEDQVKQFTAAAEEARNARLITTSELQEAQERLVNAHRDLTTAQTQISTLTRNLEDARTTATETERDIEVLRDARAADEKNILDMKAIFADMRESQIKSLAGVEAKIAAIQPSALPARRNVLNSGISTPQSPVVIGLVGL
ncbi:hypothetical protein EUX98_g4872 [Antrodiella citrinella]|uniref:Uncharacterized protein n=1 Tax=Antrodiella citrinella TaxID=2447956 RepID=A0A4S4MSY3_9APHY|nr:hypothetical protein EUX98_g4872 [Antrodiella citrinella]